MIDTHVHFWNFDPVRDSWINEDMQAIRKDFSPKNILRTFHDLKITGCIAVQANQTEQENDFLLSLAEHNELIKGIVGWVNLRDDNISERLNYWSHFKKIKGWRHVLQAEQSDFFLSASFINGLKQLKNFGYTYDLLCYHDQLKDIIKMVEQVNEQPFILDHCGKPDLKSHNLTDWEKQIQILASNPNVHCKISGLLVEADWKHWRETDVFKCFDVIFKHFGSQRVMYASDWPVVLLSRPYQDWFQLVKKYTHGFTILEKQQIFSDNAKLFYQI